MHNERCMSGSGRGQAKPVVVKLLRRACSTLPYLCIGFSFGYLSLITDAYSKMIVGYCLYPYLNTEGCLIALEMALTRLDKGESGLIHHSDRGSQYCSFQYVRKLQGAGISISMT